MKSCEETDDHTIRTQHKKSPPKRAFFRENNLSLYTVRNLLRDHSRIASKIMIGMGIPKNKSKIERMVTSQRK